VRGTSPEHGPSRGVYFDRPPRAHIDALDGLMLGGEGSR
jgi:hypothetical protein